MARADYWNHNVHYQPVILRAVPPGCGAALEVGCGDGLLASRLAERCAEVTAIDRDAPDDRAGTGQGAATGPGRVRWSKRTTWPTRLADASFDFACANTSLHHMDFAAALAAMARVLRPGGRLAVVGLAANGSFGDYLANGPGIPVDLALPGRPRQGRSRRAHQGPRDDLGGGPGGRPRACSPACATAATCCGATRCCGANRAANATSRP